MPSLWNEDCGYVREGSCQEEEDTTCQFAVQGEIEFVTQACEQQKFERIWEESSACKQQANSHVNLPCATLQENGEKNIHFRILKKNHLALFRLKPSRIVDDITSPAIT
jgi:hypothetical protein